MDDILTDITDLFLGNGVIISIACMIIGLFLKGTFKKLPNKFIPLINAVIAVILGFIIPNTYSDEPIVSKIIILVFIGLSATGLYEALCSLIKTRFSIDVEEIINKITGNTSKQLDITTDETESQDDTSLLEDNDPGK